MSRAGERSDRYYDAAARQYRGRAQAGRKAEHRERLLTSRTLALATIRWTPDK